MESRLDTIDLMIVLVYLLATIWLGVRAGKKQETDEDYFLAGRRMPWPLVGISVLATLLSTITFLSVPGEIIRYGLGFLTVVLAYPVIYPVMVYVFIPFLFRLPVTSVYEYLEKRFDSGLRTLVAAIFLLLRFTWMAGVVFTASFALSRIIGISPYTLILLMGLCTTYYTTLGGIRGVIWTDVAQSVLLVGGLFFCVIYVCLVTGSGPLHWWALFSRAEPGSIEFFSLDPTVRLTVVAVVMQRIFWTISAHTSDQVAVQRYLTTSSVRAARRSFIVYLAGSLTLTIILGIAGLSLFTYYSSQSALPLAAFREQIALDADLVFPNFIANELPTGLSGLMVAALLAAAMSSLSSGINSISTVLVVDFFRQYNFRTLRFAAGKAGKWVTLFIGLTVTIVSVGYTFIVASYEWNLLEANLRLGTIFTAPLAVPFFSGVLFRRPGSRAATLGILSSAGSGILLVFSQSFFGAEVSFLWIVPFSLVAGVFVSVASSYFFEPASAEQLRSVGWTQAD